MTHFRKILLAGTASLALAATPALAADVLGGASGAVSGATSGAVDATGAVGSNTVGGSAGAATDAGVDAGANGASVGGGVNAEGAGSAEGSGLSTGAKGGVSVNGEAATPSAGEVENSIEGAAAASREKAESMTDKAQSTTDSAIESTKDKAGALGGKAKSTVSGAAENAAEGADGQPVGLDAEGKGAVDTDTGASIGDGASLRSNTVTETFDVAQGNAGGNINVNTPTNTADRAAEEITTPELDPTAKLTEMGYTDIEPLEADNAAGGEIAFNATNAEGEDVKVVVDGRTGAVVSEQPAENSDM